MRQKGFSYLLFIFAITIWTVQANVCRNSVYTDYPCVESAGHSAYLTPFLPVDSVCETPSTSLPPVVYKGLSKGEVKFLTKLLLLHSDQPDTRLPGYVEADNRPDLRLSGSLILRFVRRLNI